MKKLLTKMSIIKTIIIATLFATNLSYAADVIKLQPELAPKVDKTSELKLNIYSLGFLNSTCTGSQISKQGHVLVARHCIEPSISWGQLRGDEIGIKFEETLELGSNLWKYIFHTSSIANQLQFPIGIDDQIVYGSIATTSSGSLNPRFESQLSDLNQKIIHNQLTDVGYSDGGDFAVVLIPDLAGRNCLKIAEAPVEVGNLVSNKAFPCFKENKAWPQVRNGEVLIDTLIEGKLITEFRISKGNFLVTHGAEECNSGSPVFNSQGEIAGILHTVLTDGISMAVHMKRALDLMDASTKEVILDLNKECKAE